MLKVGITGGIGSGKSTACKIFESLGVPIYDTDSRAKFLTNTLPIIREEIIKAFGEESYNELGMNRRYVGDIVFTDKNKMDILNSIIHPEVEKDFQNWCIENKNNIYVMKEAAIMFEANAHKNLDIIITVIAPLDKRIERIKLRDPQRNKQEILNIISNQMSDEEKINLSDYTVLNDTKESLNIQILNLDKIFRNYQL